MSDYQPPKSDERTEALDQLRELLPTRTRVYTVIRHVSASGMSRWITLFAFVNGRAFRLDGLMVRAGLGKFCGEREGLYVTECGIDMAQYQAYGMDMARYQVHLLGLALHGDGDAFEHDHI